MAKLLTDVHQLALPFNKEKESKSENLNQLNHMDLSLIYLSKQRRRLVTLTKWASRNLQLTKEMMV